MTTNAAAIIRDFDSLSWEERKKVIAHISTSLEQGITGPNTSYQTIEAPVQKPKGKRKIPSTGLDRLLEWGILKIHDKLIVSGAEDQPALLLDSEQVAYNGEVLPVETWVKTVKGWGMVNIYDHIVVARNGQFLKELRDTYKQEHGIF